MSPDPSLYDDDLPAADPASFAGSVEEVEAGQPFVGALFAVDDEGGTNWLAGYTAEAPGTLADVAGAHGPGDYQIRTLAGHPHPAARRLGVTVGHRAKKRGGGQASPSVAADEVERMRAQVAREAEVTARRAFDDDRRAFDAERDTLTSEVRREKLNATEATDRADRLKRELDEAAGVAARLRTDLADAQRDAAVARQDKADAQLQYARDVSALERKHLNELERLRSQVATLDADARVAAMELRMAQNGESLTATDRVAGLIETAAGPLLKAFADRAGVGAPALPAPAPHAPAPAFDMHTGDGHASGDGFGTVPYMEAPYVATGDGQEEGRGVQPPAHLGDGAGQVAGGATDAEPDGYGPLHTLYDAAVLGLGGTADAPDVPAFTALVQAARAAVAEPDPWRVFAGDLLDHALAEATDPARVVRYLSPIVAPMAAQLAPILALPGPLAVGTLTSLLGLDVDALGKQYLRKIVKALKPALAKVAA